MSGKTCVRTYCNYGSYLRTRGYDKAFCDLIEMIEHGKIPIGPFKPKDKCNALVEGTLEVEVCPGEPSYPGGPDNGTGQVWIQGGYAGEDGIAQDQLAAMSDLSLQAQHGANVHGPMIQIGQKSVHGSGGISRVYVGGEHIPCDSSGCTGHLATLTNQNYFQYETLFRNDVHIMGDLQVDGSGVLQLNATAETLKLESMPNNSTPMFQIFNYSDTASTGKELVAVYTSNESSIFPSPPDPDTWKNQLAFAIDGYPGGTSASSLPGGQTAIKGRTRALKGITITNKNDSATMVSYERDATNLVNNAADIYGNVDIKPGNGSTSITSTMSFKESNGTTNASIDTDGDAMFRQLQVNGDIIIDDLDIPDLLKAGHLQVGSTNTTSSAGLATRFGVDTNGNTVIGTGSNASTLTVHGATTLNSTATLNSLQFGSGQAVNSIKTNIPTSTSAPAPTNSQLATALAIKTYVDNKISQEDLDFAGDGGTSGTVDLDTEVLNIVGGTTSGAIVTTATASTTTAPPKLEIDLKTITPALPAAVQKGSQTRSARVTVDQYGRVTSLTDTPIDRGIVDFKIDGDNANPQTVTPAAASNTVTIKGSPNISTSVTSATLGPEVTISLNSSPSVTTLTATSNIRTISGGINVGTTGANAGEIKATGIIETTNGIQAGNPATGPGNGDIVAENDITAGGSIHSNDNIIAAKGIEVGTVGTAATGEIKAAGNIETTAGSITATTGDIEATAGTITATGAKLTNLSSAPTTAPFGGYHTLAIKTSSTGGNQYEIFKGAQLNSTTSSLRYKENLEIMSEEAAADLMKIMPRTFNYIGSDDKTFGLIAEELAGTELKAAVANDQQGRPDAINYGMLVAPLLRIVQEQNERIKALEEKVEALSK